MILHIILCFVHKQGTVWSLLFLFSLKLCMFRVEIRVNNALTTSVFSCKKHKKNTSILANQNTMRLNVTSVSALFFNGLSVQWTVVIE